MFSGFPKPFGTPGFDVPDIFDMHRLDLQSEADVEVAREWGIDVAMRPITDAPAENRLTIYFSRTAEKRRLKVTLLGKSKGSIMVLGGRLGINGNVVILGDGCRYVDMGGEGKSSSAKISLSTDRSHFYFGRGATANQFAANCTGQGNVLLIGEDCMFASGVVIYPSDFHAVFDMESGAILNEDRLGPSRPVILEPHVWLGSRAMVLKGVTIGAGSIVGAASVISRSIPRFAAAAGNPAKVVRRGVSWTRQLHPKTQQIELVRAKLSSMAEKAATE